MKVKTVSEDTKTNSNPLEDLNPDEKQNQGFSFESNSLFEFIGSDEIICFCVSSELESFKEFDCVLVSSLTVLTFTYNNSMALI